MTENGKSVDASMNWKKSEVWNKWKDQMQLLRSTLLLHVVQSPESELKVANLIQACISLYEASHIMPTAPDELLACISGRHCSPLEAAFMWIGGWRPTSAITLVYSKMGFDVRKADCPVDGSSSSQKRLLSQTQLTTMNVLHNHARDAEIHLSNQLATLQMFVADQSMTEAIGVGSPTISALNILRGRQLMDSKLESLFRLLVQANELRLHTVHKLQSLLTPVQAGECILAAFELGFIMKTMGAVTVVSNAELVQKKLHQMVGMSPPFEASRSGGEGSKLDASDGEDVNAVCVNQKQDMVGLIGQQGKGGQR